MRPKVTRLVICKGSTIDVPVTIRSKSADRANNAKINCDPVKKKAPPIRKTKKCAESLDETRKDSRKFSSWYSRSTRSFGRSLEKSKSQDKIILDKSAETKRSLSKQLRKLSRSSLTIEPDMNLSKYSPCASRLAASSKILAADISPDSPLHQVSRSRSPFKLNKEGQPELSLSIHCVRKDTGSCVTSPASEATTISCSPTGTEIVSLDEVTEVKLDQLHLDALETKC